MYLNSRDILNGQEGKAYATIKGTVHDLCTIKTLEANVEKEKSEFKTLGRRVTQHKAAGAKCSGSMTYYTGSFSTVVARMMYDYIKKGVDTNFELTITNADPSTTIGKRTIVLYDVNIDAAKIAALDVESEGLEEDLDFTFTGFEILNEFGEPVDYFGE